MSTYRHPDPAVRREMRRIRRKGPRYGADARFRRAARDAERTQQDAARAKKTRTHLLAWLIVLTAVAVFAIGWDHTRGPMDLPRPVEATDTTATPLPHPGVSAR